MRSRELNLALRGALRGLLGITLSVGGLLVLVGALVMVQAQRDETRPAGAAVVLGVESWSDAPQAMRQVRLDHALDLYQRGVVARLILTGGGGAAESKAYLVERGVPESALLLEDQGDTTLECLRGASELARQSGIGTVLLVSDPSHMLRSLKIARDAGLTAYGSPAFNSPTSRSFTSALGAVGREAWSYLGYIFVGA